MGGKRGAGKMALAAFVLGLFGIVVAILAGGLHQVPEGHVAMYWFGGALTDTMNDPGWHWQFPLVYTRDFVQLTLQTDTVTNVPCGTSTGVIITFDRIDVVNQLDRNKAHSTIKRFGVQYDRTFVFDKIAHRDAEIAVIQAEREANVTLIDTRKRLAAKEGEQRMEAIHNAMTLARRKAETDAAHYAIVREAEATNAKLTEAYLRYTLFTSLANSTKIYFGEKIPTIFSDLIGA